MTDTTLIDAALLAPIITEHETAAGGRQVWSEELAAAGFLGLPASVAKWLQRIVDGRVATVSIDLVDAYLTAADEPWRLRELMKSQPIPHRDLGPKVKAG